MSFHITVNASLSLLRHAEYQTQLASLNMANARVEGYSRKVSSGQTAISGGQAVGVQSAKMTSLLDRFLQQQLAGAFGQSEFDRTISEQLQALSPGFGKIKDKASSLSGMMSNLQALLTKLKAAPGAYENSKLAVEGLKKVAGKLNELNRLIQDQRSQASNGIEESVGKANSHLSEIHRLNREIAQATARGDATGDLEDQRNLALKKLGGLMDIRTLRNSRNEVHIYTTSGSQLLGSQPVKLSYSSPSVFSADVSYPTKIGGLMADGKDLTGQIKGGRIGALIQLRDKILPAKQAEIDVLTKELAGRLNEAASKASPYPPGRSLTSTRTMSAGTAFSGTGSFRVAVTDDKGVVQSLGTVSLTGVTTIGGLVTKLNALAGVSASVNADGKLEISATDPNRRLALDNGNALAGGKNISHHFGFQDVLLGDRASNIQVRDNLESNPQLMPRAVVRTGADLKVGGEAVSRGDGNGADLLIKALTENKLFAAAGSLGSQSISLEKYGSLILSELTSRLDTAKSSAKVSQSTLKGLQNDIARKSGVNMNEEVARMTEYQRSYQAGAQVLSTTQTLFNSLIQIFR